MDRFFSSWVNIWIIFSRGLGGLGEYASLHRVDQAVCKKEEDSIDKSNIAGSRVEAWGKNKP